MSQSAVVSPNDAPHDSHGAAHEAPSSFIKTPQQLLVVLLLSFLIPIFGIVLLVHLVLGEHGPDSAALEANAVAMRIQPVGRVEVVDANAPKVFKTGEELVKTVCGACHMTGAANAPKIGDKAAWGKLYSQGLDALTKSSIKGKNAMPPRAGVPDLSDFELARAIVFMANQSGGSLKEPAEPKPAAEAKPAAETKAAAADAKKK